MACVATMSAKSEGGDKKDIVPGGAQPNSQRNARLDVAARAKGEDADFHTVL